MGWIDHDSAITTCYSTGNVQGRIKSLYIRGLH
ncbi:MAG: hypothetical protein ACYS3N_12745 [Planctomycetota bacterium]